MKLWNKRVSGIYERLDCYYALKAEGKLTWPDYCELPISAAMTLLTEDVHLSMRDAALAGAEVTACWMWRRNKVVYSFDKSLADVLVEQAKDTKDSDILPTDLLYHLPYPCIYIKAKLRKDFDGFWVWVEYDIDKHRSELRIQWVKEDGSISLPSVLHLLPGEELAQR